jgi:hypothetical protein
LLSQATKVLVLSPEDIPLLMAISVVVPMHSAHRRVVAHLVARLRSSVSKVVPDSARRAAPAADSELKVLVL